MIPGQCRHAIARLDTQPAQCQGQPLGSLDHVAIAVAVQAAIGQTGDDFLVAEQRFGARKITGTVSCDCMISPPHIFPPKNWRANANIVARREAWPYPLWPNHRAPAACQHPPGPPQRPTERGR